MKKVVALLLILNVQALFAQAFLSEHHLELKKNMDYHQSLTAADSASSQMAVFVADKDKITAFSLNGALFFKDSLTAPRPDDDYEIMAGFSFSNKQPSLFWASADYKKIQSLYFDYDTHQVTDYSFEMPFKDETIVSTYSENNSFYIITLMGSSDKLKFYIFNKDKYTARIVDFTKYDFTSIQNKKLSLNSMLQVYPLQKIETKAYNNLEAGANPVKMYVTKNETIFTFDYNSTFTQMFAINNSTYTVQQTMVPQVFLKQAAKANSYYYKNKLYQIKLNADELALSASDLTTGEVINTYLANNTDSISFANSPLFSQSGRQRPKPFKDTKRFLRKAATADAGLSVYQLPYDLLVTVGGVRGYVPTGNMILGVGLALGGYGGSGLMEGEETEQLYFDSVFDDNFNHKIYSPTMLAVDHLSQFLAGKKNITLQTVTPFSDYYVLGYYDAKAKKYNLRRFMDDVIF